MNKTSDEFDKECGAKGDQWKGPGKGAMGGRDSRTDTATNIRFGRIQSVNHR